MIGKADRHRHISFAKSIIRIALCIASIVILDVLPMAIGFVIAEVLGILEELVDDRK